ncbi:hypothetical protein DSUL_150042 [Desulfovibrionales bacterium]
MARGISLHLFRFLVLLATDEYLVLFTFTISTARLIKRYFDLKKIGAMAIVMPYLQHGQSKENHPSHRQFICL